MESWLIRADWAGRGLPDAKGIDLDAKDGREALGSVVLRNVMDVAHRRREVGVAHPCLDVRHRRDANGQRAEGVP